MLRRISWVKAALRTFQAFPVEVQLRMTRALEIAAAGEKADSAKPMKGLGAGVFEIALPYRGDAFRAI
jgi:phage-related protein